MDNGYNNSVNSNNNLLNAIKGYQNITGNRVLKKKKGYKLENIRIEKDCIYIEGYKFDNIENNEEVIDLHGLVHYCQASSLSILGIDLSMNDLGILFNKDYIYDYPFAYIELVDVNIDDVSSMEGFLSRAQWVNLSHNRIRNIEAFEYGMLNERNVWVLDLSYNSIDKITSLYQYVSMKRLNLSTNKIENISVLTMLRKLESLDVSNNNIKKIEPLTHLCHLKELNICGNDLDDIEEILFIRNLLNIKYDKALMDKRVIDIEKIDNQKNKLKELMSELSVGEIWNVLDEEISKVKENELKSKIHEFHPLRDFDLYAIAENNTEEEDYVVFLADSGSIVLVNLAEHDYIPSEYQLGFISFRDYQELVDYIRDGYYVV